MKLQKSMQILKRALYLGYYLKQLNRAQFWKFLKYVGKANPLLMLWLIIDCIWSIFKYNISILEFFQFRFNSLNSTERAKWAGTGFMYEFQLVMNPKNTRDILDDKRKFYQAYRPFIKQQMRSVVDFEKSDIQENWSADLKRVDSKYVFKQADGKCGKGVAIISAKELQGVDMVNYMKRHNYDLQEEFIEQHSELMRLSPSAVNTIRIFTQLDEYDNVCVLGCRLRISVNSHVDNMAAGNLAASIDENSGVVNGLGHYSDITKAPEEFHPITKIKIPGFQIPFWKETLGLAKEAALWHKENRSIGWDIAITETGPTLIEGNHDWCKLLWQLPVQQGLKSELLKFKNK